MYGDERRGLVVYCLDLEGVEWGKHRLFWMSHTKPFKGAMRDGVTSFVVQFRREINISLSRRSISSRIYEVLSHTWQRVDRSSWYLMQTAVSNMVMLFHFINGLFTT